MPKEVSQLIAKIRSEYPQLKDEPMLDELEDLSYEGMELDAEDELMEEGEDLEMDLEEEAMPEGDEEMLEEDLDAMLDPDEEEMGEMPYKRKPKRK